MSTILPASNSNGNTTPQIVISTVHGLAITVPIDLLTGINNARILRESVKTNSPTTNR